MFGSLELNVHAMHPFSISMVVLRQNGNLRMVDALIQIEKTAFDCRFMTISWAGLLRKILNIFQLQHPLCRLFRWRDRVSISEGIVDV